MNRYLAIGMGVTATTLVYLSIGSQNSTLKNEKKFLSKKINLLKIQSKIKKENKPRTPSINDGLSEIDFLKLTPNELADYKKEIDRKLKQSELIMRANNKLLSDSDRTELKRLLKNYGLATEAEINLILNTK